MLMQKSNLKSWKEIYEFYHIPRATFSKYKNGKLSLPENIYQNLIEKFNKGELENLRYKITSLKGNWGKVLGGRSTYEKHKNIFDEGRKKGIKKILASRPLPSKKFENMVIDDSLAYFTGLIIGDGFSNK